MDTFDGINQRRSVRAFDPTHRFTAAEETRLLEAVLRSPTSFDMQNGRFVVVRDTELRKQIRAAHRQARCSTCDATVRKPHVPNGSRNGDDVR